MLDKYPEEYFKAERALDYTDGFRITLTQVKESLRARLEHGGTWGDTEVMRLVDEIVKKEGTRKPRRSHIDMLSDDPFSHKDH